jgi:hypothetical protein
MTSPITHDASLASVSQSRYTIRKATGIVHSLAVSNHLTIRRLKGCLVPNKEAKEAEERTRMESIERKRKKNGGNVFKSRRKHER